MLIEFQRRISQEPQEEGLGGLGPFCLNAYRVIRYLQQEFPRPRCDASDELNSRTKGLCC